MSIFLSQFPFPVEKQLNKVEELNKVVSSNNCRVQIPMLWTPNCVDT